MTLCSLESEPMIATELIWNILQCNYYTLTITLLHIFFADQIRTGCSMLILMIWTLNCTENIRETLRHVKWEEQHVLNYNIKKKIEIEILKYIRNLTQSISNLDFLLFVDFVDSIKHTKLVIRRIFIPIYVCSDNRTG